jgi:hypothetical protein
VCGIFAVLSRFSGLNYSSHIDAGDLGNDAAA